MENISTGLKWVIGIIVTILIVAAGVSIYLIINNYFIRAQEQTLAQTQMINQAEFSSYDNKEVSGQDVLNAALRYKGRAQFSVMIKTGENTTGFYAKNNYGIYFGVPTSEKPTVDLTSGSNSNGDSSTVSEMMDLTKSSYGKSVFVNTMGVFKAKVYKDLNDDVRLIEFVQK
jgi:hypothetical protein